MHALSGNASSVNWNEWLAPRAPSPSVVAALQPGRELFIYGSGSVAGEVLVLLRNRGLKVRAILDGNTRRTHVADLPVQPPDDPFISAADRARIPVVLGVFNAFVDTVDLRQRLAAQGWGEVIGFLDLHVLFSSELGDRYWLAERGYSQAHGDAIVGTDALWADDASRSLYRQILRFRVTGDDALLPVPDPAHQYFPSDIAGYPPSPLRLVDGGACTGDTLGQIAELEIEVVALALFEPDPVNFGALADAARSWAARGVPAFAWPCGLYDNTGLLRFSPNRGAASGFSEDGELTLPVAALDDVISGFEPNLIKLDIEGAERAALIGGMATIRRHCPALAVCVYHRPDDLWTLPAFVRSTWPGYRLYLRLHRHSGFDIVLYAVPVLNSTS
jgi:FkbM family methyltransferase